MHGSGVDAPAEQKEPGVHGSQAVWPSTFWKVPAAHLSQAPIAVTGAAVPGLHGVCSVLPVVA